MNFTPEQALAVTTHDRDLVVIAGAGSGKTFVLVERFLALLEADPAMPLNAVMAITFTEKAAAEMRQRVREGIQRRALEASTPVDAAHWSGRLAAMDSARIGTIHALCASILRANAAEAGIDPDFAVLDEIPERLLLDAAMDDVLRRSDDVVGTLLAHYDGRGVRTTLARLAKLETALVSDADTVRAQWTALRHELARGEMQDFARWFASSAFKSWQVTIPEADRLGSLWLDCQRLLDDLFNTEDIAAQIELLTTIYRTINLRGGSAKAWGGDEAFAMAKEALRALRTRCEWALNQEDPLLEEWAAWLIPYWSHAALRVRERYREMKAERRALDFDDLERITAEVLPRETVRARYAGTEIRHVLVDEFQDTNAAQWQIVRSLTEGRPGSLFVVGDPKQSIYAFRGADVRVFKRVQQVILDSGGVRVSLAESFRTHRVLVDGFNEVFTRLMQPALEPPNEYVVEFDTPMAAARPAPSEHPAVEFLLIEKETNDSREMDAPGGREQEADALAARIKTLVETGGRYVYDKRARVNRPVGYGDIAILLQAMTNAPLYEAALKAAGIPYVTVAGRGLYDRQEVWDALNLLRAVYDPGDDLAVASVLRSPFFAVSDDGLLRLRLNGASPSTQAVSANATFWDRLFAIDPATLNANDAAAILFARDVLTKLRGMAGRVMIADLLREAYALTGYLAALAALPGGIRMRANAQKLIAIADQTGQIALGAFFVYLDNLRTQEAREGEAALDATDSVKVMTVHKSKGLEFPVVVLADASYKFGSRPDTTYAAYDENEGWCCQVYSEAEQKYVKPFFMKRYHARERERDLAEKYRLLYVAMTRTADHLIVSGQVQRLSSGQIKGEGWLGWLIGVLELSWLSETDTGALTVIGYVPVTILRQPPEPPLSSSVSPPNWDAPDVGETAPPLIAPIRLAQRAVRDLTATQIADLGAAIHARESERGFYRERWARSVYGRAPALIPTVSDARRRSEKRIKGEIVHRAIQYGLTEYQGDLPRLLRGYAWELGIVDERESDEIVADAIRMLSTVMVGEVSDWLERARQVFRELPFIYTTPDRTIHGIIDMLIERADGSWVVVDFKTAFVGNLATRKDIEAHARRYHLQVGVYAAAVEKLLGVTPQVIVDYIQHATLVKVAEHEWRTALGELETIIGDLFGDHSL